MNASSLIIAPLCRAKPCRGFFLSSARRKKQRSIHPHQGLPLYGEDAIASEGKPLSGKVLVWLAKPVPFGRAMIIYRLRQQLP